MKCLLCNLPFETSNELDHYGNFHKVDPNNYFFKKLFAESKNKILRLKCFRCNVFVTTKKHKIVHNFLKHYVRGKTKPFETKRIEIKDISSLLSYEISCNKHGHLHDLSNADELVDEFLKMLKQHISRMVM